MIYDKLSNCEMYYSLNSNMKAAFEFLIKCKTEIPSNGRHIIDGDYIYANVSEYSPKQCLVNELKWESHECYIDLQFLLTGTELCYSADRNMLEMVADYKKADDYTLYNYSDVGASVKLYPLSFVILFPNDAHIPCVYNGEAVNKKIVVKIKV